MKWSASSRLCRSSDFLPAANHRVAAAHVAGRGKAKSTSLRLQPTQEWVKYPGGGVAAAAGAGSGRLQLRWCGTVCWQRPTPTARSTWPNSPTALRVQSMGFATTSVDTPPPPPNIRKSRRKPAARRVRGPRGAGSAKPVAAVDGSAGQLSRIEQMKSLKFAERTLTQVCEGVQDMESSNAGMLVERADGQAVTPPVTIRLRNATRQTSAVRLFSLNSNLPCC